MHHHLVLWPLGLMLVGFLIGSRGLARAARGGGPGSRRSTGNRAFNEYRAETLRRLEEEQREFVDFLDRLRYARDQAEFDQFMAERRQSSASGAQP